MDNTRVISSNGTPYEKMFKGPNALTAQKSAALTGQQQQHFDHRKGFTGGNGGVDGNVISPLMYTTCNGSGQAQILMNTQSIKTATNMQFLPPTGTKATLSTSMHCLPAMQPIKVATASSSVSYFMSPVNQSEQLIMSQSDTILSQYPNMYLQPQSGSETIVTKPSFAFAHAQISSTINPSTIVHSYQLIKRTSGPIIEQNPKFFNQDNHKTSSPANMQTTMTTTMATTKTATKTGEPKTFMNSFKKCVFDYVIKPIIDTTTMFVGTDNGGKTTLSNENIWNHHDKKVSPGGAGGCGVGGGGNGSPTSKANMKSSMSKLYSDCSNHSSDSICFMSQNQNYFTNYMPDNEFFDCDDYIDGGEDTIDFVADSTNLQYNRFGSELNLDTSAFVDQSPSKNPIFYDCVNKCETPEVAINLVQEDAKQQKIADEYLDVVCNEKNTNDFDEIVKNVQYNDLTEEEEVINAEKLPLNCPKYEKPNPKSYRRKRRGKRKQQQQQNHQKKHHKASNRAMKGNGQKNRHEKIRHEVEQNIHEDIDDCSVVKDYCIPDDDDDDDDDVDVDLEIIDVDGEHLPKSPSNSLNTTPTAVPVTKSTSIYTIGTPPSPETIKSGCIFTKFFRLDKSNSKQKSRLPLRCMQQKCVPIQSKQSMLRERPVTCRRTSETSESDDSFIVFEDNNSPGSTASIDDLIVSKSTASLKDTYKRQRQISECSDDFILFEDDTDDLCRRYIDTTDEDFTDSTDDSEDGE